MRGDTESDRRPPYRLPDSIRPERYEIRIALDLAAATFAGQEQIAMLVREPVHEAVLNAVDLAIESVSAERPDSGPGQALTGDVELDAINQLAHLRFAEPLAPGPWLLRLAFRGQLNRHTAGFYLTTYRTAEGGEERIAATQFQAVDARRAFPCWDEPAVKAVFSLSLEVDADLSVIANGPLLRETVAPETGRKLAAFADSPRMSSYLVAFVAGRYVASEPISAGGVPLRVWAPRGRQPRMDFARAVGAFAVEFFARYYDMPFPGEKLDLIAVPGWRGNMENLGAITFNESLLLIDEESATHENLVHAAEVIMHEIAHHWFGNLVTMRWWDGLWLNEAFALFAQKVCADAWRPAWEAWATFGAARAAALATDGLRTTRPVQAPVGRPEEAWSMFDVLTYNKGAAVLRMFEQYLGPEVFRRGVSRYLQCYAYGTTDTDALWDVLAEVSGVPVRALMHPWIVQPGYPQISAELVEGEGGAMLQLSQQRFLYLDDPEADGMPALHWPIPVRLRLEGAAGVQERWLLLEEAAQRFPLGARPAWVVVNAGGDGYYRVSYAPELLAALTARRLSVLSAGERFNLVNDAWAATLAGRWSLAAFLDFTRLFVEEPDPGVWLCLLDAFTWLSQTMGAAAQPALAAIVRDRLRPTADRLGWSPRPGEPARERELRGRILSALGTMGDAAAVQAEAMRRYAQAADQLAALDPDVGEALITILAAVGGAERYEEFWRRFQAAGTPQGEQRYLLALARFRQPDLLTLTLARSMQAPVRADDSPALIRTVLLNPWGAELAWRFLTERWQAITERFADRSLPRLCAGVVTLTTPALEREVEAFFAAHRPASAGRQWDQILERLRLGVRVRQRAAAELAGL